MADSEWTEVDGIGEIAEFHHLGRIELLSEITHELRSRILRLTYHPTTVADMAASIDVPVTRLYHHVNRLERSGLIQVVATRKVGGVVERRYRAVAETFSLDPRLLERIDGADLAKALGVFFDIAKVELQTEVEAGVLHPVEGDQNVLLTMVEMSLTEARQAELRERLVALLDEFGAHARAESDRGEGQESVALFLAAYPNRRSQRSGP